MNHDLTHCDNYMCEERMRCVRYLAHLERIDRRLKGHVPYLLHNSSGAPCVQFLPSRLGKNHSEKAENNP